MLVIFTYLALGAIIGLIVIDSCCDIYEEAYNCRDNSLLPLLKSMKVVLEHKKVIVLLYAITWLILSPYVFSKGSIYHRHEKYAYILSIIVLILSVIIQRRGLA